MNRTTLRGRLLASTIAWLSIALLGGAWALSHAFARTVQTSFDERLQTFLLATIAALEVTADGEPSMTRSVPDPRFDQPYSGWYWQVTAGERTIRSRSLWDQVLDLHPAADGAPAFAEITGPRQERLRAVGRSLHYPSRKDPVAVIVAGPASDVQRDVAGFNRVLALSLGVLGVGLAVAAAVQVGYGLRPLRKLATDLARVRAGEQHRLAGDYPGEIAELVDAMNDVLEHDTQLIERARTSVGNLAHALKTPLAVVAAEVEQADRADGARIGEQVRSMTRLVNHHLARASAAATGRLLGARTEVEPVVSALKGALLRIYSSRNLRIDADIEPRLSFAGERQDLEEMLGNLIDNACKWAESVVRVSARAQGEWLYLDIDDDGPGLDPEESSRALERGTRLRPDTDAPGSGLGLAIAADLAQLYGGSIDLSAADLGGLRVRLRLPR
jgi:signal transduction histidine kinase